VPGLENYLAFWASLAESDRMDFTGEALAIARAEGLEMLDADHWDTLGWVFADRAQAETDQALAVTGIGLAAAMFDQAERLRTPKAPS
jgi:hypothetical protein